MRWFVSGLLCAAVAMAAGCKDGEEPPRSTNKPRARRPLKTPPGKICAVPPHAIFADGVGPYKLGTPLNDALDLMAGGPRIVVVNFPGVLDYHYIPAEEGTIIIGARHSEKPISFIGILDPKIARTKSGLSVGVPLARLVQELGKPSAKAGALRDRRVVSFDKFPGIEFVVIDGRVRAALIRGTRKAAEQPPPPEPRPGKPTGPTAKEKGQATEPPRLPCDPNALRKYHNDILAEAGTNKFASARVAYGCFYGGEAGAMVREGDRISVVGGAPGKFRVITRATVSDLTVAGAIDINGDGRNEIVLGRVERKPRELLAHAVVLRVEGPRLQRLADKVIYSLKRDTVEWTGAKLRDIEFLLEFGLYHGRLKVGGLYFRNGRDRPRMIAPLKPALVRVRYPRFPTRIPTNKLDAGVPPK